MEGKKKTTDTYLFTRYLVEREESDPITIPGVQRKNPSFSFNPAGDPWPADSGYTKPDKTNVANSQVFAYQDYGNCNVQQDSQIEENVGKSNDQHAVPLSITLRLRFFRIQADKLS
jgi:hypothetical protein